MFIKHWKLFVAPYKLGFPLLGRLRLLREFLDEIYIKGEELNE